MTSPSAAFLYARERINPERSTIERVLLEAYEHSRTICLNLQNERRDSPLGSGLNTVKDLKKAIRETPFSNFQRAQAELLSRVEVHIAQKSALTREALRDAVACLVHGILLSGGCRRSEICHLREGNNTNLFRGSRSVYLRAVDRKNAKDHSFELRERWLPDWFLSHYLHTVTPVIAVNDPTSGTTKPFLVLNPSSRRPYGCPEEDPVEGAGREPRSFRNRKKQLATLWKKHVATAFVSLGFHVPSEPQQFGMHIVRNVGGHAVFVVNSSIEKAAIWLGDSVGTVEGVYADLKGELVDTSLLDLP